MLLTASIGCQPRLASQMSRSTMSASLAAHHQTALLGRHTIDRYSKSLTHYRPRARESLKVVAYQESDTMDNRKKQVCRVLVDGFRFSQAEAESYIKHPLITKAITADPNLAIEAKTFRMRLVVDTDIENEPLKRLLLAHPELFARVATALADTERVRKMLEYCFEDVASIADPSGQKAWYNMLCTSPEILLIEPRRAERMLMWWRNLMDAANWSTLERADYIRYALMKHPKLLQASALLVQTELKTVYLKKQKDWELSPEIKRLKMNSMGAAAMFSLHAMGKKAEKFILLHNKKCLTPQLKKVDQRMAAKERAYDAEIAGKREAFEAELKIKEKAFNTKLIAEIAAKKGILHQALAAEKAAMQEAFKIRERKLASEEKALETKRQSFEVYVSQFEGRILSQLKAVEKLLAKNNIVSAQALVKKLIAKRKDEGET